MSNRWQEIACLGLRLTGMPWFLREVIARRKVTVINYHDPRPEVFARQMAFFARAYSFITIDQLAQALETGDFSELPAKPLLVTLDDAHLGNARLFDTFRKYGIPAVIYAVAGVVDTKRGFWFDRLPHGGTEMTRLKTLPDRQRRAALEAQYGHTDHREYATAAALSAEQLRELIALGGSVGSHTLYHPMLDRCDDQTGERECVESRRRLQRMLDTKVEHFALPNGNQDERTRHWVGQAGYRTCRTTRPGRVTTRTDRLALPNFAIADTAGPHKAVVQACGLWDGLRMILGDGRSERSRTMRMRSKNASIPTEKTRTPLCDQPTPRVLLNAPDPSRQGGVASFYRTLRPYLPEEVDLFTIGPRTELESTARSALRFLGDYIRFFRTLRGGNHDLVHLNPSLGSRALVRDGLFLLIAKCLSKKVVVFNHGWNPDYEKILRRRWLWPFRKVFFRADAFVLLAGTFRESLIEMGYRGPIHPGTTCVDDSLFSSPPKTAKPGRVKTDVFDVLFLTRVERAKGIFEALDAFRRIKAKHPRVRLTIVGEGAGLPEARDYVKEHQLQDVEFKGYLWGRAKQEAFLASHCYLFPSHTEGMPLSVLEAMAYGLPVVTRPVGGLRDFFEDGKMGYATESMEGEVFARLLEKLLESPADCETIGAYNRQYAADHFAASQVASRLVIVYKSLTVKDDVAGPTERTMRPGMRRRLYDWTLRNFRKREPILRRGATRAIGLLQAPADAGQQVDVGTQGNSHLHLVVYDNASLVGRYPVAFTHKRRIILEASVNVHVLIRSIFANARGLAKAILSRRKRSEYGHLCVFSNIWSSGYFHWTLDDLTRLEALRQFRKQTNTPLQLLMVPPVRAWQLDSLKAMGFGEEDLVIWDGGKARVERLYVSPARRADRDAAQWLRRHAAEDAGCREETAASRRIYISRADADERQVANERDFFAALAARGFESFRLSELDYHSQVRLFWEADVVVGPHGAGLTNLIYSRPGAALFELSPSQDVRGHFQRLCDGLGLAYERALCKTVGSSLVVDLAEVLPRIDRFLQMRGSDKPSPE